MAENRAFRYDPLYRVIDVTSEMRVVEGRVKGKFDRLKRINNLGIIPEVFEMAKYPKYEHALGTVYQVNALLEIVDPKTIPKKYRVPLTVSSLFLHLGHLPYTYSTERALLLASNLGNRTKENEIKKYVKQRVKKVLKKIGYEDEDVKNIFDDLFSMKGYKFLYRFFSADLVINSFGKIKKDLNLSGDDLKIILDNILSDKTVGYKYLSLADKADFVQRDALYFGTVRIDISPKHLYSHISLERHGLSVTDEERLIDVNLDYLADRFYKNAEVAWFSALYEKILASLLSSKRFRIEWLDEYDDEQLKRLMCSAYDKNNKKISLPPSWVQRAKNLFDKNIRFYKVFGLENVFFPKEMDVIDIEYQLIGKRESQRGLLRYPFESGILINIEYPPKDTHIPIPDPDYYPRSLTLFQEVSKKNLGKILDIIRKLSSHLSLRHTKEIREAIANQISWSGNARLSNEHVQEAIIEAIRLIDKEKYKREGDFIDKFLKDMQGLDIYRSLLKDPYNKFLWKSFISYFLENREQEDLSSLYDYFSGAFLGFPVRTFQFKKTKQDLDMIYEMLLSMLSENHSTEKKGHLFEALCLIDRLRTKRGDFQFIINGMKIIDPTMPSGKEEQNEYDIIEFLLDKDSVECRIYACSIRKDYKKKNEESIRKLVDSIHEKFPDIKIKSRYLIPKKKSSNEWGPIEKNTGRNY